MILSGYFQNSVILRIGKFKRNSKIHDFNFNDNPVVTTNFTTKCSNLTTPSIFISNSHPTTFTTTNCSSKHTTISSISTTTHSTVTTCCSCAAAAPGPSGQVYWANGPLARRASIFIINGSISINFISGSNITNINIVSINIDTINIGTNITSINSNANTGSNNIAIDNSIVNAINCSNAAATRSNITVATINGTINGACIFRIINVATCCNSNAATINRSITAAIFNDSSVATISSYNAAIAATATLLLLQLDSCCSSSSSYAASAAHLCTLQVQSSYLAATGALHLAAGPLGQLLGPRPQAYCCYAAGPAAA